MRKVSIFLVSILSFFQAISQPISDFSNRAEFLLEVSHGFQAFQITSDIPELCDQRYIQEGGAVEMIVGNSWIHIPIQLISYYDISLKGCETVEKTDRSIGLEISWSNILIRDKWSRLNVYTTGKLIQTSVDFKGLYLPRIESIQSIEPIVGWIDQQNYSIAGGISYRFHEFEGQQVKVFAEFEKVFRNRTDATSHHFTSTSLQEGTNLQIGLQFGLYRPIEQN